MVVVPSKMGQLNKRALLARLQRLGTASRADLAKSLGLSQPTAGKIADDLLRLGVIEEVDDRPASPRGNGDSPKLGRPGRMLRLNRSQPRFIAVQLGVSETAISALPVGVDHEDRWALQVPGSNSAADWIEQLRDAANRLPAERLWGVLVSVPGIVDERSARVLFSPNLHWTEKVDLVTLVRQVWPTPVVIVQEERALALGHQYLEPEHDSLLLVDVGDGVGGAVIVSGQVHTGPLPISGELGHTPVLGNERRCGCGAVGCLETLTSTRGLLRSFAEAHPADPPTWEALRQRVTERGVEPWLATTLDATAVAVAGALNVIGLRQVVVTGSLTDLPASVMQHLDAAVKRGTLWERFGHIDIQAAPRRRTAGLVAAGIDRLVLPMTARAEDAAVKMV